LVLNSRVSIAKVVEGKVLRMLEKPSSYRVFAPKVNFSNFRRPAAEPCCVQQINKRKQTPDVPIVFNSSFEPWYVPLTKHDDRLCFRRVLQTACFCSLKYTLDLVKDVGMNEDEWTSTRLKKEVMYFESPQQPTVR
jgi:hypothetical protein